MQIKKKTVTGKLLLAIFISYLAGCTLFTHTHIVNGIIIVHSHFYKTSDAPVSQESSHQHSKAALDIIDHFSHFSSLIETAENHLVSPVFCNIEYIISNTSLKKGSQHSYFLLRGPPTFF